jgi:hypothetical protein
VAKQLWATYSVKDHLEPRSLAADIMLFDHLVFPVPMKDRYDYNGTIEWEPNPAEWTRWELNGWDPTGQQRLLDVLKPVVRKVSWDPANPGYDRYRLEARRLGETELSDSAFEATRTTLTLDLPAYVTGIAALGPAYRSVEEVKRQLGIGSPGATRSLPGGALPIILAWEFFVPDPDDKRLSSEEMLKETVDFVSGDAEFRERRTAFMEWQQNFLRSGATDSDSINRAIADMRELLNNAKKASAKLKVRKIIQHAFQLAPSALGLAAAFAGVPDGVAMAAGGGFISVGSIAVDELLFKTAEQNQPLPVAFVHDARRQFGWK